MFMTQDSLAVHILAEHMHQGWSGTTLQVNTVDANASTSSASPSHTQVHVLQDVKQSIADNDSGDSVEVSDYHNVNWCFCKNCFSTGMQIFTKKGFGCSS